MTSGISKASTTIAFALASAISPSPSRAAPDVAADAKAIVATLKRAAPAKTAFTEVRFSGLLDRPLILRGELEYDGPDALSRRVESPYLERTIVANGEASVQRGDGPVRAFSLGQAPELEAFLRGFAALLGGDAAALDRDFALAASGSIAAWRLTLKPRDARLAKRIASIDVDGSDRGARCFRTSETDGDVNVLLVESLATAKIPVRPTPPMIDALCRGIAK